MCRNCFGNDDVDVEVTQEQLASLLRLGGLQSAGLISHEDFCERAKAVSSSLVSNATNHLVVKGPV